ncbi:Hypothetical protein FKW44_009330, partial [Caligus rogercresseyi]
KIVGFTFHNYWGLNQRLFVLGFHNSHNYVKFVGSIQSWLGTLYPKLRKHT